MNLAKAITLIATLRTAGKTVDEFYEFLKSMVKTAEADAPTGTTGAQKLDAVLSATGAYLTDNSQSLSDSWNFIQDEVKAIIAALVKLWNSLGIFKKSSSSS